MLTLNVQLSRMEARTEQILWQYKTWRMHSDPQNVRALWCLFRRNKNCRRGWDHLCTSHLSSCASAFTHQWIFFSFCSSHSCSFIRLTPFCDLFLIYSDAEEEGELEPAKELIQPIAEKLMAKSKAKEEETPLLFFVAGEVTWKASYNNQHKPKW